MGDVEGEVGDGDEEEGGDESGDEGALHPPDQVQLEAEVGVRVLVVTLFKLGDLGKRFTITVSLGDSLSYYHCFMLA